MRVFLRDAVLAVGPQTVGAASSILNPLLNLATWWVEDGNNLDIELMLDPYTVERFISVVIRADSSRGTYRSTFRRIGPLLTRTAPWEPRPEPVTRRSIAVPYQEWQLDVLWRDALYAVHGGPTTWRIRPLCARRRSGARRAVEHGRPGHRRRLFGSRSHHPRRRTFTEKSACAGSVRAPGVATRAACGR